MSEVTMTTTWVPMPCPMCGKPEHGTLACSSAPGWPTFYVHTVCPDCAEKDKRIVELKTEVERWRDLAATMHRWLEAKKEGLEKAEAKQLRCCGNCRHSEYDGSYFDCEWQPRGEDEWDDLAYPSLNLCCYAPSRWEARP